MPCLTLRQNYLCAPRELRHALFTQGIGQFYFFYPFCHARYLVVVVLDSIPYQLHACPVAGRPLVSWERFPDAFGFVPFPGGDMWLARQHFALAGLVPKRRFADQKSDARVFAARAHSFCVLQGPRWFCRFASRSRDSRRGAVDAGGSDQDTTVLRTMAETETALVQNVNRRLDL